MDPSIFGGSPFSLHVLHEEGRHGVRVPRAERPQHGLVALAALQASQLRQILQRLRQAAAVGPGALRAVGPGELGPLGAQLSWRILGRILWESW